MNPFPTLKTPLKYSLTIKTFNNDILRKTPLRAFLYTSNYYKSNNTSGKGLSYINFRRSSKALIAGSEAYSVSS